MTTCARCGLPDCPDAIAANGGGPALKYDGLAEALGCRERELANLRSLLRSVTGKLEKIREAFGDDGLTYLDAEDVSYLAGVLDQVLEALS